MRELLRVDKWLFHFINGDLSNPVLDASMPVLTDLHKSIIAVCLFAILVSFWLCISRRKGVQVFLLMLLTVCAADIGNHRLIKPIFSRLRPEFSIDSVIMRSPHHYGFSFPSNHATNCFAAATIVASAYPGVAIVVYTIAAMVAFSRVYVGVHFPLDVFGASLLGVIIGKCFWLLGRSRVRGGAKPRETIFAHELSILKKLRRRFRQTS